MDDFSSAWPYTEEGASQGAQSYKAYISSRFTFRITATWGAQSQNTVVSNRFPLRNTVSWGAQSQNVVVSSFTGCPFPELGLCQQQVHRLAHCGCVILCVSQQCAEPLDACTSHPKKKPWGMDPSTTFTSISISSRHHLHKKVATSPQPSRGPLSGRKCSITLAISRIPIKGDKIKNGYLTPAFSGAHMRA